MNSYEALISGSESEAFVAMTGCPPDELYVDNRFFDSN